MSINLDPNVPAIIDVITPEPALIHPSARFTMTQGQRQLIHSFVEAQFGGDLQAAINEVTRKMTLAQQVNWELHVREAASTWANAQNAHLDVTDAQVDASLHFVALLQLTKTHEDPQVNATIRGLGQQVRNMLIQQFLGMTTQGEYNRARKRLTSMVPNLVKGRKPGVNSDDEGIFANTGEIVVPPAPAGDEEPF